MTYRDEPDNTPPRCPHCCLSIAVTACTVDEQRWGHNWYCEADRTYFAGTATEYQDWQIRKAVRAAESGELDQSHRAGQNQGVLGGEEL